MYLILGSLFEAAFESKNFVQKYTLFLHDNKSIQQQKTKPAARDALYMVNHI